LALSEGVEFMELLAPVGVKDGVLTCRRMELGAADASGRRSPVDTGETVTMPATAVITAVGETVDDSIDTAGAAAVIGDMKRGPATVVEAIADATAAAVAIAGMDPETEVGKNITADYDKPKNKHGNVCTDCDSCDDTRCLGCATVCETCTEVCPNRANIAVKVPGMRQAQIVHVDGMCNECGNCATFCPYDSRPYRDKFTLYWSEADFKNSENDGFLPHGADSGICTVRLGGSVKDYDVTDASCGLYEDLRQLILAVRKDYGYLVK
ncbi:MAG: putative selenate reductase subunit YgfK, partial [Pseudoflavonifractor sp.]